MLPDPGLFLLLALLGGWVAVDGTSLGQFMVSRPFVAATLAGWAVGNAPAGMAIGLVLEAFNLTVLPVGAARYPEAGPPAVVAGALFASSDLAPGTLVILVVLGLGWEWVAGRSVRHLRVLNIRLVHPDSAPFGPRTLERRHLGALGLDFLRGVLLVATGLLVQALLLGVLAPMWGLDERGARVAVVAVVAGLLAGSARLFPGRRGLFVAGALAALAFRLIAP